MGCGTMTLNESIQFFNEVFDLTLKWVIRNYGEAGEDYEKY
jgi:hypothetical protein